MSDADDFIRQMQERDPAELERDRAEAWGEPADDDCVDRNGDVWPEHNYRGNECRRCGAEAEQEETP
jgi:hypothetical protein